MTDQGEIGSSMHALLASLRTILASLFSSQFNSPLRHQAQVMRTVYIILSSSKLQ